MMKNMTVDEVRQLTVGNEVRVDGETYQVQRVHIGTEYPDGDADVTLWTMDGGGAVSCFASEIEHK
jgi:hypothetical protein